MQRGGREQSPSPADYMDFKYRSSSGNTFKALGHAPMARVAEDDSGAWDSAESPACTAERDAARRLYSDTCGRLTECRLPRTRELGPWYIVLTSYTTALSFFLFYMWLFRLPRDLHYALPHCDKVKYAPHNPLQAHTPLRLYITQFLKDRLFGIFLFISSVSSAVAPPRRMRSRAPA